MSDMLRVAMVAEGPTDRIVIEAAMRSILSGRSFVLQQLQPEGSLAFGQLGSGWTGVYRWCKQAALRGSGRLGGDALLFENYDLLILHLDADVAGATYSEGSISPEPGDAALPCERPCPPASDTTDALRAVLLTWCGETCVPYRTILCTPSKSTEAWVVSVLFPQDRIMQKHGECLRDPESRLGQQPLPRRIRKTQRDYLDNMKKIEQEWPRLSATLNESRRFQMELLVCLRDSA